MNRITRRPGYPAPRAMPSSAAIAIPTRGRPGYLDVALASIVPQAAEHGAEVLVVDDGPDAATREVARRHGVRYVAHERPLGLNVARNAAIDATDADLLVFVDDDVAVKPGWLGALVAAADARPPDVGVFTGPIHARIEDHRFPACGREGPPITFLDVGPEDVDLSRAWGANMAIRRSAIDSVGRFAEDLEGSGDEEEWQARWEARGGRIRYVAAAALDHRRARDAARPRRRRRAPAPAGPRRLPPRAGGAAVRRARGDGAEPDRRAPRARRLRAPRPAVPLRRRSDHDRAQRRAAARRPGRSAPALARADRRRRGGRFPVGRQRHGRRTPRPAAARHRCVARRVRDAQ